MAYMMPLSKAHLPSLMITNSVMAELDREEPVSASVFAVHAETGEAWAVSPMDMFDRPGIELTPIFYVRPWDFAVKVREWLNSKSGGHQIDDPSGPPPPRRGNPDSHY